ncbi:MAG TPA: thioredoxin domain-containing protein [Casimicrobiaceae bacterium]|jgi:protein-disulfide isomerase
MITRNWRTIAALALSAVVLAAAMPARADGITSEQAQQILDELKAIRKALEQGGQGGGQAAPAPDDKVSMAFPSGGFSEGKKDAPLVLVEYTDYQCPFCQQFHNSAYTQIKANYIDTGKVLFVSRDFPLDFHENARRGANAARCAGEQGKYWELRHAMIVNASQLQQDKIASYAANVKIDVAKLQSCIAADKYKSAIDKDIAEGMAAGVNGTPSFVLGRMVDGKLTGVRLVGAMPYEQFDTKIQAMLSEAAAKN